MLGWTQELLDQIDYLATLGRLPDDLALMYKKLPKKGDGTLNMQYKNKTCHTFVSLVQQRKDFLATRDEVFKKGIDHVIETANAFHVDYGPPAMAPAKVMEEDKEKSAKAAATLFDSPVPDGDNSNLTVEDSKLIKKLIKKMLKLSLDVINIIDKHKD